MPITKDKFKKTLAALLSVLMVVTMLPGGVLKASAASTLSITQTVGSGGYTQDADGNIAITAGGSYTISGGSTTAGITVASGVTADVTLDNVNIGVSGSSGKCAFSIASGAAVNLTLSGTNTLISDSEYAGLQVPYGASVSIAGTGSLTATSGGTGTDNNSSAGIGKGNNNASGGSITISSGTVTAQGIDSGSGINGDWVYISGGSTTAYGGECGSGIDGSTATISGGTVATYGRNSGFGIRSNTITITGGSVYAHSVRNNVTNGNGKNEYRVAVSTTFGANVQVTGSVNGGPTSVMQTDENGNLHFWMPYKGSAVVEHDSTYYSANVAENIGGNTATLSTMTVLDILTGNITVTDNSITQTNNSNTYSTNDCVITQSGSGSTQNTVSVTGGTHGVVLDGVNIDVSSISGKGAFAISNSNSSAFITLAGSNTLKSGENYAGLEVAGTTTLTVTAQGGATLDVTGGQYSAGIGGGGNNGDICGNITINGGNITAHGGVGLNQYGAGGAGIGGGPEVSGGTMTINGGTVFAYGARAAAGIGSGGDAKGRTGGTITITSGTVNSTGGFVGAGIGGGDNGAGGTITVSGGTVTASGHGYSAGIGGADTGKGANLTITGGTVMASGDSAASIGGGDTGSAGTTVISGGSVKANSIQDTPTNGASTPANVYRTTVSVPKGTNVESLSLTQSGSAYSYGYKDMQTDAASYGKLYLWLPANDTTTADMATDGGSYTGYHGKVDTGNASVLKMDQNLTISGAADHTYGQAYSVLVTGGDSGTAAAVTYSGHDSATGSDLPANDTTQPTDAGSYTVAATKAGNDAYSPGTASVGFTITQKSLTDSSVTVADISTQKYDGSAHTPAVSVKDGSTDLIKDKDYTVTDKTTNMLNPTYTALGSYTLEITGKGYYSGTVEKAYMIEAAPGIVLDYVSGSNLNDWYSSVTLAISYTVGNSGLQGITVSKDGSTAQKIQPQSDSTYQYTATQNGTYTFTVTSKFGFTTSQSVTVRNIDTSVPTVSSVSGNLASPAQSAALSVTAMPVASGIGNITVSRKSDSGQWVQIQGAQIDDKTNVDGSHTYTYTTAKNGTYKFTVTSTVGVSADSGSVDVTQIDTVKPIVNIDSGYYFEGKWSCKDVTLKVLNTVMNTGTPDFEYSMNGMNWQMFNGSLTDSAEGVTTYSFRGTSISGVVGDAKSITVKLDKTAPTNMTIGFQQNPLRTVAHFATFGLFFDNTVDVNFAATDSGSGVDHYEYQTVAEGSKFNSSGIWQIGSLSIEPDFKGAIYARAVDQAGNVSGTVIKSLVVDKTVPIITSNLGNPTLNTMDANASIPVEIKDRGAGVSTVTYQVNGGASKTIDLTADTYSDLTKDYSFNIGNLPDGAYDVNVNAQDNSGNAAATATVHVVKNAAQTGFGFTSATLDKTYGDAPFNIAATGGEGGGTVTYAVTSGAGVLSVDTTAGKVSVQKPGTAVITATKAATNGYRQAMAELTVNVSKVVPMVQTLPTASDIQVIEKLSSGQLMGGKSSVPGTFSWTNPDTVVSSSGSYAVTFIPTDSDDYAQISCNVPITVVPLLSDSSSNTQLDFTSVTLPAGVTSVSLDSALQSQTDGGSTYSVVEKLIGQNKSLGNLSGLTVYDLKLLDQNGEPIAGFTGKIKVKIPIPTGMNGNLKILWYDDKAGTLHDMGATQENGYLVFETTHFSYYAIAQLAAPAAPSGTASPISSTIASSGTTSNIPTGDGSVPLLPLALLGAGSAVELVIVKKSTRYKLKKNNHRA